VNLLQVPQIRLAPQPQANRRCALLGRLLTGRPTRRRTPSTSPSWLTPFIASAKHRCGKTDNKATKWLSVTAVQFRCFGHDGSLALCAHPTSYPSQIPNLPYDCSRWLLGISLQQEKLPM
jgi:hypothetical protein